MGQAQTELAGLLQMCMFNTSAHLIHNRGCVHMCLQYYVCECIHLGLRSTKVHTSNLTSMDHLVPLILEQVRRSLKVFTSSYDWCCAQATSIHATCKLFPAEMLMFLS